MMYRTRALESLGSEQCVNQVGAQQEGAHTTQHGFDWAHRFSHPRTYPIATAKNAIALSIESRSHIAVIRPLVPWWVNEN